MWRRVVAMVVRFGIWMDQAVIDAWQRFVADPLQMRGGISLDRQCAVWMLLTLVVMLAGLVKLVAARNWIFAAFAGLNLTYYLKVTLFGPRPSSFVLHQGLNPLRYLLPLVCARLFLLCGTFCTVSLASATFSYFGTINWEPAWVLSLHAATLTASCDIRPPRRKKERLPVPVPDWI